MIIEFFPPEWAARIPPQPSPSWQEQVIARGWAYAILSPTSIQADNGAGLTRGIIGLVNKGQPRKPDDWGALRAWAWGASRALDYLATDPAVDAKRAVIEGVSRYGKASLVTMAYEPRFAIGFIGSSGMGGASAASSPTIGELLENVAGSGEYHWMAGNYIKYAGPLTAKDLPVDSHELIALAAPRPLFIGAGNPDKGDAWVDPTRHVHGDGGGEPGVSVVRKARSRHQRVPAHRNSIDRGRAGLSPARGWSHVVSELADVPRFREPAISR